MTELATLIPEGAFYRLGDSGPVVKEIQLALARFGFKNLTGTGYFGSNTDTAVEAAQKRLATIVDGDFGHKTALLLDAALAGKVIISPEAEHEIARPLWVEAGIKLIGVKETPGGKDNKVIIDWAKDEGGNIARDYTHDSIPWCALFANHILTKCDIKGTETLWALDFAGKWPSNQLAGPAVGAFAPMLRDGGGHIMVVVGRDQHGNIMGLGGNQSDMVSIVPFARTRLNKGFWWPKSVVVPNHVGFDSLPLVRSDGKIISNFA